tara:strand:+ start:640 stop:780 length:141 start_codon:yes stop_codon:yes gene_type:complete
MQVEVVVARWGGRLGVVSLAMVVEMVAAMEQNGCHSRHSLFQSGRR